jgi:imidazolonepropionase-like amidohydrolase
MCANRVQKLNRQVADRPWRVRQERQGNLKMRVGLGELGVLGVLGGLFVCLALSQSAFAQVAIRGETVHTMAGPAIKNGVILIRDGKIAAIGSGDAITIPDGVRVLTAKVVTPGLIDAHSTVGLTGIFNIPHDQDQLERSSPIQPELRAIDAYNPKEELVDWVRSFGVTTIHTGHGPGELVSGQTIVVKTWGSTVEQATLVPTRAVAATLSADAQKADRGSPGTRSKMMSMLRAEFIKAREYRAKRQAAASEEASDGEKQSDQKDAKKDPPARDLRLEALVDVLDRKLPLLVTAHRSQDIANTLRLAKEFEIDIWLDGAAEAHLLVDQIKAAGVPVFIHPMMARPSGELRNFSLETPAKLHAAGIPVVFQSGYESYVPKTRVVLFEAAKSVANGLTFDEALGAITRDPARILGIADRVGTLEVGKDGDAALYDGDPFEYTTHCVGVVIEGQVASGQAR